MASTSVRPRPRRPIRNFPEVALSTERWSRHHLPSPRYRRQHAVLVRALTKLESPHLDLVMDFCERASAASIGKPCTILQGSEELLCPAMLIDFVDVQVKRPWGYRPPGSDLTPFWWRLRRDGKKLNAENRALVEQVEQVNEALRATACLLCNLPCRPVSTESGMQKPSTATQWRPAYTESLTPHVNLRSSRVRRRGVPASPG
jgi:hypothetical protein